jgi:hypothetical protein
MYAESSEKKMSHARVAFALLCGLAVCCSVMYITADAGDEYMHEMIKSNSKMVDAGTSVGSTDVLKAGQIYTETPDGRMRLMDYFNNVEKEISDEVANRKADIASVRAQMARDFAFNSAARAKLKRDMLHKMAINAKIARRNLNKFLRKTQRKFAQYAYLYNKRQKATEARDKQTLKYAADDKRESKKELNLAVSAWQKSTNAWSAATNARIDRMNKHVAANAAQIKENAKRARKDLEVTMHHWDKKVANFRTESKNARSRLSAQFAAQSKATRAWANNKIKGFVASTAAQFNDVETKMAKNRHDIDMALRQATMRFEAALNAEKALEDKRYAETVASIAAAKQEAAAKVNAATAEFKVQLLTLSSTVKTQVSKVNNRIDKQAGVVRSNAAAQAKVNANVNAEMTRMIKLGNKRYKAHLKGDEELQNLIAKDKAETDQKLNKMALEFNAALADVRKELAADRKHAETQLKKSTGAVFAKLYANQAAQEKTNAKLAADTRRMRLDAMDAVRDAKAAFRKKIHELGKVVATNDKKADKKIQELTGVVTANAAKSRKGREQIAAMEAANKEELKDAIAKAIATGEKRAQLVEERGTKMDKDTKWLLNNRLDTEITKLRDETNAGVEALALQSKEARDQMKKEMLYAIRSAAEVAKQDLDIAVKDGVEKLIAFNAKSAKVHAKSELERKALNEEIKANADEVSRMIKDAVSTDARAQVSLKQETAKKIKKTNTSITAKANQMKKIAKETRAALQATETRTLAAIATQQKNAAAAVEKFSSEDAARQKSALDFMEKQMKLAEEEMDAKFGKAYGKLAKDREHAEDALGSAVSGLNDALAKQAALADSRFEKTVADISAARKQAATQVADLRKEFGTELALATAETKHTEQILVDNIAKVSGEVISMKANQIRVNVKVKEDLARVEKLSNDRFTKSTKARGKLRMLMDENKQAAAEEVKALSKDLEGKIAKLRSANNVNKISMQKDLTKATTTFYEKMASVQKANLEAVGALNSATSAAKLAAQNELARAQKGFDSKIVMLSNVVTANAKKAEDAMGRLTGVVHATAKKSAKDRALIKEETKAMEADLNKALNRAISIGEAKAKAVEQRIAEHLKNTQRFLQVELTESVEEAADNVFKILEGKRQKIADNYLSLKAYACASADKIQDVVTKGHGRAMSSIGDFLVTVGSMGPVRAKPAEGLGMGGAELPEIFSGKTIKVSNAVAAINGLVNEYTGAAAQVRNRWPMGLGKYLLDKLEESMLGAGVLQVDKVDGKSGNFVFINGRSVGLSNKMSDFSEIAARMTTYESVLAKLTSKITAPHKPAKFYAPAPEWQGQ